MRPFREIRFKVAKDPSQAPFGSLNLKAQGQVSGIRRPGKGDVGVGRRQ